jgi:hypothetical protein
VTLNAVRAHIPHTSPSRREPTYARLIRGVCNQPAGLAFEGKLFRCGIAIDDSELWPDAEYPPTPLLIEFAGRGKIGWGHNRSTWLYILWRYDREEREWRELCRASAVGAEWVEYLKPAVLAELRNEPRCPVEAAMRASGKVLVLLDGELGRLSDEERRLAMTLLYEQFTARLAEGYLSWG